MMHGLYEMGFYGLREAAHHGVTCPNDMVDGTRYIKSFVNGKKNNDLKRFLWSLVLTRICRTWAWTAQAAKYISTHQAQKKGSKFGKQPIYRGKPWRKKHKNSRAYRWIGKPCIRLSFRRKCTWCFKWLKRFNISNRTALADQAYGAKAVREYMTSQNAKYCIPPKSLDRSLRFHQLLS